MKHLDLTLMKHEVWLVFDSLFGDVPQMDCSDIFDGDTLSLFAGRHYSEVPEILRRVEMFPFFSLVDEEVGKYYFAGYLIHFLNEIEESRDVCAIRRSPFMNHVEYVTLLAFLEKESVSAWIRSVEPLAYIVRKFLGLISNTVSIDLEDKDQSQIDRIRKSIT